MSPGGKFFTIGIVSGVIGWVAQHGAKLLSNLKFKQSGDRASLKRDL
jgi:hypothetical protein